MIFFVIAVFIGIGFLGSRNLIKKKSWREVAVFFILLSFGFTLIALQTLDVKIPSPGEGIRTFFEKVLYLSYK
ncbi:hypothetical protein [Candidatus Soleaferrea massiliensis]|jgi:hypothetical protein|uniref:hypothetical protein n=1 Tax=Candidatus Soleaferrea massiliensis TaxID=1470354 RepID=UPI00069490EA|nr:hypothetical protein [Candidatus Soleaferrea massiliensis]